MALSNTGITNRTETEWVALMCLSSTDGEQCLQPLEYQNLQPYQKVWYTCVMCLLYASFMQASLLVLHAGHIFKGKLLACHFPS